MTAVSVVEPTQFNVPETAWRSATYSGYAEPSVLALG
jgi:hypothetical protein